MRLALFIASSFLVICMQEVVAEQSYPISPPPEVPFYETAIQGDVVLYVGYGYDLSKFEVFAFDLNRGAFVAREQYETNGVTLVCEGEDGVVLSRPENPLVVSYRDGAISMQSSAVACPDPSSDLACGESRTLFHGRLPGRLDTLSICYSPDTRAPTFHITSAEGVRRDLGAAGTSPGGSGVFVVTHGVKPNTFLTHHTRSAIPRSAVLIDADADTLAPFNVPDLSDARPSMGFGAGLHGVTLHPVQSGLIVGGHGGHIFFLRDSETRRLEDNAIYRSIRVTADSCIVTYLVRSELGIELRVRNACNL